MMPMTVPEPVMSLAVMPKTRESSANFSKALNRFQKEDPTFKVRTQARALPSDAGGRGQAAHHGCPGERG